MFVNALLQEMNVWHSSHPKKDKRSDEAVKKLQDFAGFLYEHLGVKESEAGQEAKAFDALDEKSGQAIMLKHFSADPYNPATAMTLSRIALTLSKARAQDLEWICTPTWSFP